MTEMVKEILKQMLRPAKERVQVYLNYYGDPECREWYFKYSKHLLRFKDIHKGEGCFIIGNGPSLNMMDLKPLRDYHTFGLNKIYLIFDRVKLNLSYHVAVNPLVIEQCVKEFEFLSCPSFLSYRASHNVVRPLKHIHFILTGGDHSFKGNLLEEISEGYTVTYVAMQIAFYMGFQKVFLIGVDHNYNFLGNPNEEQLLRGGDPNHFDPGYFRNKKWHNPDLEASELSYHLARFYFNRSGRHIYDATVHGKLQIFSKISFKEALAMCSKKH